MALDTQNFRADVIERSREIPVVVDFWAPWCGPCRTLGPIIERLAEEAQGKWELVKLNTDQFKDIANQYKIRSIPAVKIFFQGRVIAEMVGALPQNQMGEWINQHLPDPRKMEMAELIRRFEENPLEVQPELEAFIEEHPDLTEPRLLLANATVMQQPEEAVSYIEDILEGSKYFELADRIRQIAHFLTAEFTENSPVALKLKAAREAALVNDQEATIQLLIEAVMLDKSYLNDLPRKTCIALFQVMGTDSPVTLKYRRRFDMALY
ncbi:MAG: thioredoxin [Bacteroidia bacterium]|nr:thioredoxin [Bacteroidia bacterium]